MAVEHPKFPLRAWILNVEPLNSDHHLRESAGSSTAAQRIVETGQAAYPVAGKSVVRRWAGSLSP